MRFNRADRNLRLLNVSLQPLSNFCFSLFHSHACGMYAPDQWQFDRSGAVDADRLIRDLLGIQGPDNDLIVWSEYVSRLIYGPHLIGFGMSRIG